MPPRAKHKVKTLYQKAEKTPSLRIQARPASPGREPKGLAPLTKYIEDNLGSGLSQRELIEQFQEYDCDHPKGEQRIVAQGSEYRFIMCGICQKVEKKLRPGVKD